MPNFKIDIKTTGEDKLKKIVDNIDQVSDGFDNVNENVSKYNKIIDEASKKSISAAQSALSLKNAKLQEKMAEEALLKAKLENVKTDKLRESLEAKLAKNSADQIKLNADVAKSQSKLVEEELKRSKIISDTQKQKAKLEIEQLKQISDLQKQYEKLNNTVKNFSNADTMKKSSEALSKNAENMKKVVNANSEYIRGTKASLTVTENFIRFISKLSMASLIFYSIKNGIQSVAQSMTDLVVKAGEFEKFQYIIDGLEGSTEKGRQTFERLVDFAKDVPQTVSEITEAFIKLKGQGLDSSNEALRSYADVSLAMGKPMIQAIEMMADSVTGEFERLKEYGITAQASGSKTVINWVDTMGKARFQIVKDSKEMQSALLGIFDSKFAGQTAKFQQSFEGIKSTLINNRDLFQKNLAEQSGLFQNYKNGMTDISNQLEEFMKSGKDFESFSKQVGDSGRDLFDVLSSLAIVFLETAKAFTVLTNSFQFGVGEIKQFFNDLGNTVDKGSNTLSFSLANNLGKLSDNPKWQAYIKDVKQEIIKQNNQNTISYNVDTELNLNIKKDAVKDLKQLEIFDRFILSTERLKKGIYIDTNLAQVSKQILDVKNELTSLTNLESIVGDIGFDPNSFVSKMIPADLIIAEVEKVRKTNKDFMKDFVDGQKYVSYDYYLEEMNKANEKSNKFLETNNLSRKQILSKDFKETQSEEQRMFSIRTENAKNFGEEGNKITAQNKLKELDNIIKYNQLIGNETEVFYAEINKMADENNASKTYTEEQMTNIFVTKYAEFLKKQEEQQLDYSMSSIDQYIKYYEAIGDIQTTAQLKIAKGNIEIMKQGFQMGSPEQIAIEKSNKVKALKEAQDERDKKIKDENDLKNKLLDIEIMYYESIGDIQNTNIKKLEKFRNDLREKGVIDGSKQQLAIVAAEEKKLNEEREKKRQDDLDDLYKKEREKLDFLEKHYEAIGDIENKYATKNKIIDLVSLNTRDITEEQKRMQDINAKNQLEKEKQIELSDKRVEGFEKERFYNEALGNQEIAYDKEKLIYKEELMQKGYQGIELENLMAQKEKEHMETYRKDIKEKMGLYEAFQAQIYNSTKELDNSIRSSAELTADVTKAVIDNMTSGLESFFDASSESFLDLKDLTKNVVKDMLTEIAKLIAKQQAAAVMSAVMGGSGGMGGFSFFADGGAFSKGSEVTAFASGGTFTNSIASSPTLAPMALFGEAGPEAIMPLTRGSDGKLGVSMNGGMQSSSSTSVVNIIINNNASNKVSISESTDTNGNKVLTIEEIDIQLSQKMRTGTSKISSVMENKYKSLK